MAVLNNRDHAPIVIEEFNGQWKRGDADSTPIDHFTDGNNYHFIESGVETRPGIDTFIAKNNIVRMYNYVLQTGQSLLLLDDLGNIWHALLDAANTVMGPILSIPGMTDFGFIAWDGRAYITPFTTFTNNNGNQYQKGLQNDFLYVYKGDGSAARKAAGFPPTNGSDSPLVAYNSSVVGVVDLGIHIIAVAFTAGGDRSGGLGPEGEAIIYAFGGFELNLNNIPLGDISITGREIYMTKAIDPKDWNPVGDIRDNYTFYLAKTIADNTTISTILSVADADLTAPFAPGGLVTPTNSPLFITNTDVDGYCDLGLHIVGVVYETDTGYLTAPGPEFLAVQTYVNEQKAIKVSGIPVPTDPAVIRKHLVSSIAIEGFNGNNQTSTLDAQLFFIPTARTLAVGDTEWTGSYYDADLIDDASHLIDNFSEIPAGVGLFEYHSRMGIYANFTDISVIYGSAPGEPEAINQVDGVIILPLDGNPVTNAWAFRDVLYGFKKNRTYAIPDNDDEPSTWEVEAIDEGVGASVHGIATVLDSGGVNIEFLLIIDLSGLMLFNGVFSRPELSWKIQDFWLGLDRNLFDKMQIVNDTLNQIIYITTQEGKMEICDYKMGLNYRNVRWAPWSFDVITSSIALINTDQLIIAAKQSL